MFIWNLLIILLVSIPNLYFECERFSSNKSAKFEKNPQKLFALSLELKETTPFFSNDILDCFSFLEGIP